MQIISKQGDPSLAEVYVAKFRGRDDLLAEFVDARDTKISKNEKWVIIVSTQFGCPVECPICDSGGDYKGNLNADEIFAQIDAVVRSNPDTDISRLKKFKIQFARMGEPALNDAVLDVLEKLPKRYNTAGLIPCITTVAPRKRRHWFERLIKIRHEIYGSKPFQLQFSINSTDETKRNILIPIPKMGFDEISQLAVRFHRGGSRKVVLNFAVAKDAPIDPRVIADHFNPETCCVKLTPLNPTTRSTELGLENALLTGEDICSEFRDFGFDVILSIGDARENEIGSNCGMAIKKFKAGKINTSTTAGYGSTGVSAELGRSPRY